MDSIGRTTLRLAAQTLSLSYTHIPPIRKDSWFKFRQIILLLSSLICLLHQNVCVKEGYSARLVVPVPSLSLTETTFMSVLSAKYRTFGFRVVYKSGPWWKK